MKRVVVASDNPVKISVAKGAFCRVYPDEAFEFIGVKSKSGVPDQPINEQTKQGAINRLDFIKTNYSKADFWISQEGGIFQEEDGRLCNQAWIAVCDKTGYTATSATAQFYLPSKIVAYLNEGMELGDASDKFFNSINSKQGAGTIGHLTDGLIDRENYYLQAAIIALSELKHRHWYE
jgi:inosine/xanthosine triphosphatase